MLKSAQTWAGVVVTRDATGALATPSVGPAGTLYVNGISNAASVTITGSNPYKWSVTLPSLTAGDICSMYITATISSVATAAVVAEDTADTKRVSDLNDLAAGAAMTLTAAYDAAKTALAASAYTAPDNADILLIKAKTDNLPSDPASNTQVNTRLATSGYTAPPTAAAITNAVLDEATASHQTAGSVGKAITDAGGAGDPLSTALNTYPSGSYGALLNSLNPQHVTLVSPVSQSGTAEVVRGMDYSATDGLALDWTFSANPDLTGATIALYIYSGATLEATWTPTVVTPTAGAGKVRVQATNAQTAALRETTYAFAIWATLASARRVQLYAGTLVVLPELRP